MILDGFNKIFEDLINNKKTPLNEWNRSGIITEKGGKISLANAIFKNDSWAIFSPKTYEEMATLGDNTDWQVVQDENKFNDWLKDGPYYVFLNLNNMDERYLLGFTLGYFFDTDEAEVIVADFLELNTSLIKPVTEFATNEVLSNIGSSLNNAPVTIKIKLSDLTEELVDRKENFRNDSVISGKTAVDLILYNTDFWDSTDYYNELDEYGDCFNYYKKFIMEAFRKYEAEYNRDLKEYGLTVDDLEKIMNETKWVPDEHTDIENAARHSLAISLAEGRVAGTEIAAHDAAVEALKDAAGAENFSMDADEITLTYNVAQLKEIVSDIVLGLGDEYRSFYGNDYLATVDLSKLLALKVANEFELYEPYGSWDDFDALTTTEYFVENLPDNL